MAQAVKSIDPTEEERIKVLKKYAILDTPPDGSFDKFTRLAARLLDMPIAIVSLVDEDRIWFKSRYGLDVQEIDREPGLCASAILADDLYLVEDAKNDPRTLANPLVAGEFGLEFYAAVPLTTHDGYNLGTFCVIDKKPRKFSVEKKKILTDLAELVMNQMELRMEARKAIKQQQEILHITAHDLKNPLAIMPLLADMIMHHKNNPAAIDDIATQIKDAGSRMTQTIDKVLEGALNDSGRIKLRLKALDLNNIAEGVVSTNIALARKKQQVISLKTGEICTVYGDHRRLTEVVDNLINNAIKYSPCGKEISVSVEQEKETAVITVRDEGPGLTKDDMKNLFRKFTSLSAKPTGDENSSGFGLHIVKNSVEAHRGRIYARSDGAGKGSSFVVELPLSQNA